jgi:uracil-DNA glycosylase
MPSQRKIVQFIDQLAKPRWPLTFNPWGQRNPGDAHTDGAKRRRVRLAHHLNVDPVIVLAGEAPGYQGAATTGIAFTSERLLLEGAIPRIPDLMGERLSTRSRPWSEPSASIVWETLYQLGLAEHAVLWNQFAFHPIKTEDQLHSNRTPTPAERERGLPLLQAFLALYPGVPVVAIGRQADASLQALDVEVRQAVRHPAMGGKTEFQQGMRQVAKTL